MDWMVNNNWVAWILVCKLKTYNPTVKFLKYKFNNTLLGDVTLFRITPDKTWIQPYIYVCVWRKKLGTNIFRSFDWLFFEINYNTTYRTITLFFLFFFFGLDNFDSWGRRFWTLNIHEKKPEILVEKLGMNMKVVYRVFKIGL